jgi:hypothetical protein
VTSALILLPFLSVAQQESDKYLSSQWNLTAQLEPVQDELRVKS